MATTGGVLQSLCDVLTMVLALLVLVTVAPMAAHLFTSVALILAHTGMSWAIAGAALLAILVADPKPQARRSVGIRAAPQ